MTCPTAEENVVPLDPVRHRRLGFDPARVFARNTVAYHQVRIGPAEFEAVAEHYPVLFADGAAVALFSRTEGDNPCIGEGGKWNSAVHLPDWLRCYPLVALDSDVRGIGIDEAALLPDPADGAPLFDDHGRVTRPLSERLSALRQTVRGQRAAADLQRRLEALGLLDSLEIKLASRDGWYYRLVTFQVVNAGRLSDLCARERACLSGGGLLRLIELHQHSLEHLRVLAPPRDALAGRQGCAAPPGRRPDSTRSRARDRFGGDPGIDPSESLET